MLSLALLFVLVFFQSYLALWSPGLGKGELIYVRFVHCLFILHALVSVHFLLLLVSGIGCGLWFWHSLDFSINVFEIFAQWDASLVENFLRKNN